MIKPKPCPICKGTPEAWKPDHGTFECGCTYCRICSWSDYDPHATDDELKEDSIRYWNELVGKIVKRRKNA